MSEHLRSLTAALERFDRDRLTATWGRRLADRLCGGAKLLAAGNGGSAAQAQHLTAELVGRFRADRPPFCAISLHSEPSALTAILNDYGPDEVFARQLQAHGRPGDVLLLMSTSGASRNVLVAAERARDIGVQVWAMTGPVPNPLAASADHTLAVASASTATVQELHLVALHMICEAFDERVAELLLAGAVG
ncbi:MAG TPA: SIS domain-containing protein [Jatrophihabitans sp.]|nr:SIS domain-containing protein [Jatrophihabitans sp.]